MKMLARLMALTITALFIGSTMTHFVGPLQSENDDYSLDDERVISRAATSPGHVVFAQYISSDNCPHCYKAGGGSAAHHKLKTDFPDEYVYVTYMSASYGQTNSARAGNVAPYSWQWPAGGAPDAYFGDRTDVRQSGASANYDSYDDEFTAGGGMHSSTNDYGMTAAISPNGGTFDIDISYKYTGSGSAASNMKLYAAIVEEECTTYTYSSSGSALPHGYNCWMGWLTSGDTYKTKSTGSGTAFASVSPSSSQQSLSWTGVPTSLIAGGTSNAVVVAALISGSQVSVGGSSPHVYHAIDSTMGPRMDISVSNFAVNSAESTNTGFVIGDSMTIDATVKNVGDLDYSDGGSLVFYYKNGASEVTLSSYSLNNLNTQGTQTEQYTFDSSSLPSGWKTTFGAKITGLVGDVSGMNNVATQQYDQDRPPVSKNPQIQGDQLIERGNHAMVLAKAEADDTVDTTASMSFNVEISPAGLNQWSSSVISGGQNVVYSGTANEGREYVITPSASMSAGWYDVRSQAVDSRGQVGDWKVINGQSGFELKNGAPVVVVDPIPSVMCDTPTKVSMAGHIVDPETPLSDLVVTSSDSSFIAWHPLTEELEVNFAWSEVNGCPLGQQGIELTIDDGGDYSETGELPYGTMLFRVTENGQPRWNGLPTQSVDEGGSGILALLPYLFDTDDLGNPTPVEDLSIQLISNSNEEAIIASLDGNTIGFQTVDDDSNGQAILTLRASDGVKTSDATITINIQPINDAPRLVPIDDITNLALKRNSQLVVDLVSRVVDVDDPAEDAFITVSSSESGAARFSFIDGSLTLEFEQIGMQTVTILLQDKFDSQSYTLNVDVFDAYPFLISTEESDTSYMFVTLEDTYVGQIPTVTMLLTENSPTFTFISVSWNVCNKLTGTCDGLMQYNLDTSKSNVGWTDELLVPSLLTPGELAREDGSQYKDYYQLVITAVDSNGDDYKMMSDLKWDITETMPTIDEMDETMFSDYLEDLTADKVELVAQIEALAEGEDSSSLELELSELNVELELACDDPRASCTEETVAGTTLDTADNELNLQMIGLIGGIILAGLLIGLMFSRRNGDSMPKDAWNDTAWNPNMVPAHDSVANSMYGGAQAIFQQPVAVAPAPVPLAIPGPPLPPGGLPAGWSPEQWAYYGQQYLDGTL
ncbi:MAG: hypothetical protein P8R00_04270 [Candidatus Poseidoniaceae archaeon]|nr:hypothetical protein [Candidatus Poseidoniaceae archaeon]